VRQELSVWISRLWEEKPPRYTRALMETLSLVAYKQPVTRGDIEQVRGVSVSQSIMRTLLERGWIRVVGQREAPGRPSMYGTTREFLDYFNLRSLDQLPPLAEIRALIEPLIVEEAGIEDAGMAGAEDTEAERSVDGTANNGSTPADHAQEQPHSPIDSESELIITRDSESDQDLEQSSQAVEVATELDAAESEQLTAEVVQLPTAPH
jgi:segregation and condensation protein B